MPVMKDAQRTIDAFRRIVRELRLTDARTHARTGISSAQLFVLNRIAARPAKSISELAARTLSDRTSVAALVRRLEEQRLVKASRADKDRRRSTIAITAAGRTLVRREPHPPGEVLLSAMLSLPPARLRQLSQSLSLLARAMGIADTEPRMLFSEARRKTTRK